LILMSRPINRFLVENNLRIAQNPCVSPDFCLDWASLARGLPDGPGIRAWPDSGFATVAGRWTLLEHEATGDCAWLLEPSGAYRPGDGLADGVSCRGGRHAFPATWENLLRLKNLVQEHDAGSTLFPGSSGTLGVGTLGVGARFTTLHWPAVEWAMAALSLPMTANQNSIPRELVFDVDTMLQGRLDRVPFPFIGTDVPEGHQGQSVEGMSHGCVISKLRTGFHRRRLPWSFNADHQPVGGRFDSREDALVRGCLLASYITFDISPELALGQPAPGSSVPAAIVERVRARVARAGLRLEAAEFDGLLCRVWPSMLKMKRRDDKYRAARHEAFTTEQGRRYLRELSIDELPGLTAPATTAVMLALCEALDMPVSFVAPAFGFQKNTPYPDNEALRAMTEAQWRVCQSFGVGIGFHSGSGKSAENYRVLGEVTGGRLEIKTSGRYTYEMGRALFESREPSDQALWRDWHQFTVDMAVGGAFSADPTERQMARSFIAASLGAECSPERDFSGPGACRAAVARLPASPEHMFFFEYNFLYVLAAGGRPEKAALGNHGRPGFEQRARFYAISPQARLLYARNVARYLVFLAESTGLAPGARCDAARSRLEGYPSLSAMVGDIPGMP
jgi:hypothetical protein